MDEDVRKLLGQILAVVETIRSDVTEIKAELRVVNTRLDGFEKRLDDQGRILAALIPTRIAAVPPAA